MVASDVNILDALEFTRGVREGILADGCEVHERAVRTSIAKLAAGDPMTVAEENAAAVGLGFSPTTVRTTASCLGKTAGEVLEAPLVADAHRKLAFESRLRQSSARVAASEELRYAESQVFGRMAEKIAAVADDGEFVELVSEFTKVAFKGLSPAFLKRLKGIMGKSTSKGGKAFQTAATKAEGLIAKGDIAGARGILQDAAEAEAKLRPRKLVPAPAVAKTAPKTAPVPPKTPPPTGTPPPGAGAASAPAPKAPAPDAAAAAAKKPGPSPEIPGPAPRIAPAAKAIAAPTKAEGQAARDFLESRGINTANMSGADALGHVGASPKGLQNEFKGFMRKQTDASAFRVDEVLGHTQGGAQGFTPMIRRDPTQSFWDKMRGGTRYRAETAGGRQTFQAGQGPVRRGIHDVTGGALFARPSAKATDFTPHGATKLKDVGDAGVAGAGGVGAADDIAKAPKVDTGAPKADAGGTGGGEGDFGALWKKYKTPATAAGIGVLGGAAFKGD